MTGKAIHTEGLTRRFGKFTAVDDLTLEVERGELFGFLGPNGAGKTTTIRILTTLIAPTSGSAQVAGHDIVKEASLVRDSIGVVPQQFALFDELTPVENLWYIGKLYSMKPDEIAKRTELLLHQVGLWDARERAAGGFSGGMKQRLSVAAGLLHEPDILFMDEPTTGLDPYSRIQLRELTRELNEHGITIIYTTHDMEEADKLCDRIAIMDKARMIASDTPAMLKHKIGRNIHVEVILADHPEGELIRAVEGQPYVKSMQTAGDALQLQVENKGDVARIQRLVEQKGARIRSLQSHPPSLEDVFIQLTNPASKREPVGKRANT